MRRTRRQGTVLVLLMLALLGGAWQLRREGPGSPTQNPAGRGAVSPLGPPAEVGEHDGIGQPRPNGAPVPPAPVAGRAFGADVRITTNTPGRPHNEPFVAADPLDPH